MRSQTRVGGRAVLVVWLKGAAPYLQVNGVVLARNLKQTKMGTTQKNENFYKMNADAVITDDNWSCNAIFFTTGDG